MKKTALWIFLLFLVLSVTIFTSPPVDAVQDLISNKCYNSTTFMSENVQFLVEFDNAPGAGNHYIRGRATWIGGDDPLTGVLHGAYAFCGVAFANENVRFIEVSRSTLQATTWLVNPDGNLGMIEDDQLIPCVPPTAGGGPGNFSEIGDVPESEAAGPFCFKDINYTPELHIYLTSRHLHGQAILDGDSNFPAPIAGFVSDGWAYFCINYLGTTAGFRFYVINLSTMEGSTWGVYDSDSTYYDTPHHAELVTCTMPVSLQLGNGSLN